VKSDSPSQDPQVKDVNRGRELQRGSADPPIDKTDFVVSPETRAFQEQRTGDLKRICNRTIEPQLDLRWGDVLNSQMRLIDDLDDAAKEAQLRLDEILALMRFEMKDQEGGCCETPMGQNHQSAMRRSITLLVAWQLSHSMAW
jgi:hypothetical protein